jgi:uncharacterized protein (TIGR02246 family)
MSIHHFIGVVGLCVAVTPLWAVPAATRDTGPIRALEARQETAWNSHDAHAYAQLFATDADTVNVLGWWWKSRAELEQKLARAFTLVFAHSQLHIEAVTIRFLTDDVAIAHVHWSMSGAESPDGSGNNVPKKGIQTQTLQKSADGWHIAAFQNTNAVPERAFSKGPG